MKDETRNSDTRNSALGLSFSRVSNFAFRVSFSLWRWLRAVLDDDAYDRYLSRAQSRDLTRASRVTLLVPSGVEGSEAERQRGGVEGSAALSPSEFYRLRLERKYSRPTRCC